MERLNYFNPYQSKAGYYEDQLTRAYLVLLKHSFHAFSVFFDYCRSKHEVAAGSEETALCLYLLLEEGWEIETQRGNPCITTAWLVSMLITDAELAKGDAITSSDRNARYDGIITFGNTLTMIVEVKPRSGNVWFGQLAPSRENLSEETKVYENAVHLQWKEIIRQLNHILTIPTLSGGEKMLIDDFLSFVDEHFPFLNPFDSFHLCKGNPELIHRRIQNVLKSLVIDEQLVKYHHRWGFYIQSPYPSISEIGLVYNHEGDNWWLELSFYFGNTQSQAIAFYKTQPSIDHLDKEDGWWWMADFHVSFMATNLLPLHNVPDIKRYMDFWSRNVDEICQQPRNKVQEYIDWLKDENVLLVSQEDEQRLQEKFFDTDRQRLNICPGFGAVCEFHQDELESLDKKHALTELLRKTILDGLKIIGKDGSEFLKASQL